MRSAAERASREALLRDADAASNVMNSSVVRSFVLTCIRFFGLVLPVATVAAERPAIIEVDGQPLAANAQRLMQALDFLGASLRKEVSAAVVSAAAARDAAKLQ